MSRALTKEEWLAYLEKTWDAAQDSVAFKIYLPLAPQQDVNHGTLPWVYDQDPSSGNVASMWVTPVKTLPPKPEPRNFCPRCGKRTADLTVIHTCTPPRGLEMT